MRKRFFSKLRVVYIMIAAVTVCSCVTREIRSTLLCAENLIGSRPDSALTLLNGLDTTKFRTEAMKAKFALLHAMALDKNYVDTTDVRVIMPAVRYYEHHGFADEKLKSLFYYGRIVYNAHNYENAVLIFADALRHVDEVSDRKSVALLYSYIGLCYARTHNYKESNKFLNEAMAIFQNLNDSTNAAIVKYDICHNYASVYEWNKADSLYTAVIADPHLPKKTKCEALLTYGVMLTLCPSHEYIKAVDMFEASLALSGEKSFSSFYRDGAYACALSYIGRKKESDSIIANISTISGYEDSDDAKYWNARIAYHDGDYKSAFKLLLTSLQNYNGEILELESQSSVVAMRDFYNNRSLEYEESASLRKSLLLCAGALLVMVIVIGVWMFMRKRQQHRELVAVIKEARREADEAVLYAVEARKREEQAMEIAERAKSYADGIKAEYSQQLADAADLHAQELVVASDTASMRAETARQFADIADKATNLKSGVRAYEKSMRDSMAAMCKTRVGYMTYLADVMYSSASVESKDLRITELVRTDLEGAESTANAGNTPFDKCLNRMLSNVMQDFLRDFPNMSETEVRMFSYVVARFDPALIMKLQKSFGSSSAIYTRRSRLRKKIADSSVVDKVRYLMFF